MRTSLACLVAAALWAEVGFCCAQNPPAQSSTRPGTPATAPATQAAPARRALIVAGKGGNKEQDAAVDGLSRQTADLLLKAGFDRTNVIVFARQAGEKSLQPGATTRPATIEAVTAELTNLAASLDEKDELWVFIYGHANSTSKGYSIVLDDGRMRGDTLAAALDKIYCRQVVFCMTRQSVAMLKLLERPRRIAVAACDDESQLNTPELPGVLLKQWTEDPARPLLPVLTDAASATTDSYVKSRRLQAERSCAWDGRVRAVAPFVELSGGLLAGVRLKSADANADAWTASMRKAAASQPATQTSSTKGT